MNFVKNTGIFIFVLFSFALSAQITIEEKEKVFPETKDIKDVFQKGNAPKDTSTEIQLDKNYVSFLPVVGYAPANGFVIGAAVSLSRLFDPKPTSLSSAMLNLQLTSKRQFIINARSKIYLQENKWFLQGDWRYMIFTQPTYGLGINTVNNERQVFSINGMGATTVVDTAQDMNYNYIRIYEDAVRSIGKQWFVGLGYALDYHYSIQDLRYQPDSTLANYRPLTYHTTYSQAYGFNPKTYVTSGINFDVIRDRRDNIVNPYTGHYIQLTYRVNPTFLGSSQNSSLLFYDFRIYRRLSRVSPRHLIGFWSWGSFVTTGNIPYLALPSVGWDTYNRSGRGYVQGRYRGLSMVYTEAEYRFPITHDGFIGGVTFVNATFASGPNQNLFDKKAIGYGVGTRIKMDKRARVNLTIDVAYGTDKAALVYFNLQEVF